MMDDCSHQGLLLELQSAVCWLLCSSQLLLLCDGGPKGGMCWPFQQLPAEDNVVPSNCSNFAMWPEAAIEVLPPPRGVQTDGVDDMLVLSGVKTKKVKNDFPLSGKPLPACDDIDHFCGCVVARCPHEERNKQE